MKEIACSILLVTIIGLSACNLPLGQEPIQDEPDSEPDIQPPDQMIPTLTTSYSPPMVSVSVDTNCRTGPGEPYDIVGVLRVGETAEIVGQAPYGGSWIIKNLDGAGTCWLWDQYATVVGDTQGLPEFDIPPTPTPAASFTVSYTSIVNCMGSFGLGFQLTNNGSVPWESVKVEVTDSNTAVTKTIIRDVFLELSATCVPLTSLVDLTPGETGGAGNWGETMFSYNPTGHNITATITLCSQNSLAGQCISKSTSFTP